MKLRKIASLLLAVIMVVGLLPMSVFAAGNGEFVGEATGGSFVDDSADPNKSYEYTIEGSDGSIRTVLVAAAADSTTGNSVVEHTTGGVYYQKVTDLNSLNGKPCLLVSGTKAVTNTAAVQPVTIEADRINGIQDNCEWTVTYTPDDGSGNGNQLKFQLADGKVLTADKKNVVVKAGEDSWTIEEQPSGMRLKRDIPGILGWTTTVYLRFNKNAWSADKNSDKASPFNLYSKVNEPVGANYTVDTAGLDALLEQAASKVQDNYEAESWTTFADALQAAKDVKNALKNSYENRGEADVALAEINKAHTVLQAAMDALKMKPVAPGTCASPEITWQRTWEPGENPESAEAIIQDVRHVDPKTNKIIWKWNDVKSLTASNPDPWNALNGEAATWSISSTNDQWDISNVRRFTGTFTWPAGVGMDASATIESVHDQDYQAIYDYIQGNSELQARYGESKVLPINDDMYVFISKASEDPAAWDSEAAKKHLVFWTGTSGKGIWSKQGSTNADWGRTTPATFLGQPATPAYYQSWPNLEDLPGGRNSSVQSHNLDIMTHTDGWYTMTDTAALMSTLNNLYGNETLGGQEMRIDIYAFNNSGNGGMDELRLTLCNPEATTAQVKVQYWLETETGKVLLDTSVMNNRKIGEQIILQSGTRTNELNFRKAAAIEQAGAAVNVSDGVQQKAPHTVVAGENVIDVVYTGTTQDLVTYTYDFGVENKYIYTDTNDTAISSVRVNCDTDTIGASFEGHEITLTYKPKDASGKPVSATLVVERGEGENAITNEYPIAFIPASNVLYEEDFIQEDSNTTGAVWSQLGQNSIGVVTDNHTTVYGYSDAYKNSTGANGVRTATVTAEGETRFTKELNFTFSGQGFDLIGTCGTNTGTLLVKVRNRDGQTERNIIVDTSFTDPSVGANIYQVPLVHCVDLPNGTYDVNVVGANIQYNKTPALMATMSEESSGTIDPALYEALIEFGMSDEEIANAEFIGMEDQLSENIPMLMSMAPAADETDTDETVTDETVTDETVADETVADETVADETVTDETVTDETVADETVTDETVADETVTDETVADETVTDETVTDETVADETVTDKTVADATAEDETVADETVTDRAAADTAAVDTAVTAAAAEMTVSVDGFRVYRKSEKIAYPQNEQNVIYTNVMKDGILGNITAYVEPTGDGLTPDSFAVTDYESKGGPENEIYLAAGRAIVLQLSESTVDEAQISARAVNGATQMNHTEIAHNTEMYYHVDAVQNGMIVIANTGDDLLALGNLKAACGITTINDQEAARRAVAAVFANPAVPTEPQVPETTEPVVPETTEPEVPETTEPVVPETTEPQVPETTEPVVPETTEPEENKTFAPKMLQVSLSVRKGLFAKYATLNVTASKDVAYITVNGTRVDASNELLVRLGLSEYYKFRHFEGLDRSTAVCYEVVAYDHNGNASEPVVKQN